MAMMRGRVKSKKETYGFINGIDGKDYFFYWSHVSELSKKTFKQIEVGDTVNFEPVIVKDKDGNDREQAKDIKSID